MLQENVTKSFRVIEELMFHADVDYSRIDKVEKMFLESKERLLPHFGDEGKISLQIDSSDEECQDTSLINPILDNILETASYREKFGGYDYLSFMCDMLKRLAARISHIDILNNKLSRRYDIGVCYVNILPEGMKFSKALSLIDFKDFCGKTTKQKETPELISNIQTLYSILLQKVKSNNPTVVLSIAPLDFFLVSAATTGWRSCHNWEDGEFRAGTFSYMCDKVSAVAYVYSKEKQYGGHLLPEKIWRQMVFFDLNQRSAILSREYPFENPIYAKHVRKLASKVLAEHYNTEHKWRYKQLSDGASSKWGEEGITSRGNYYLDNKGLGYKDDPTAVLKMKEGGSIPDVDIGSRYPCPSCGTTRSKDENNERLICDECDGSSKYNCDSCGGRYNEDEVETFGGNCYCSSCFNNRFFYCFSCGEAERHEDAVTDDDGDLYCDLCAKEYLTYCEHCESYYRKDSRVDFVYVDSVDETICSNCIDKDFSSCTNCGDYYLDGKLENDLCEGCIEIEEEEEKNEHEQMLNAN